MGLNLRLPSSRPSRARKFITWLPNPPMDPSSTVIIAGCSLASLRSSPVSRGLQNLASTTVTEIPCSDSISAAARHWLTLWPYPTTAMSVPSRLTTPLPISRTCPLRSEPTPFAAMSTPMPLPLGNLKAEGLSSMAIEVATMWHSSASLLGAMTTMFGTQARYATSKAPQCVAPSAPTSPARSMANLTGRFCSATSWTIWSYPLCKKVE
mmetsp:Transcript_8555/g.30871  ORF Transcript_8555/g.30871 Transcript_8555/m.30871 type:complete len:209 (-) Transcript_8555:1550-2176(-)